MAITKEKKQQMLADYADKVSHSQAVILTDYRGLTVANLTDLRRKLREDSAVFQIVKNTLFRLALERSGISIPAEQMEGTLAAGYCLEEVPPVVKTLNSFAAENELLQIRGAILGTAFLDADGIKKLADLPPREVLLAQLLGAVQGPMSSLVGTVSAPMNDLASTLYAPLRELTGVLQARSQQTQ